MRYILISTAALLLAACGTKGPLTLPPPGAAKPAVQSAPVKADDNKAQAPAAVGASNTSVPKQK
jgi:predicted small lipoprotein YifL